MEAVRGSALWKNCFEGPEAGNHEAAVSRLVSSFIASRDNTKHLVAEIGIDLPNYTVHDIEHLDALWEIASQIAGEEYPLNPVEGYVLGCAFLVHDAGMTISAYPGGLPEIKQTREWNRIANNLKSRSDEEVDENWTLETFIREMHARKAEKLPFVEWKSDGGVRHLIDDGDLRQRFGDFIGTVAASHWWSHDELESRLSEKNIPAPAPFPSSWSIDLLKLACIMRTADAAQIDDRRAPSFLRALRRNRLSEYSSLHWTFQSRLSQAQNRGDALFFASFRPFERAEANSWWVMFDTLKMVDRELRMTDGLLARTRPEAVRLASRRVANIESPAALRTNVPTAGWMPIDTVLSVSDIPQLIENLGGRQLYGDDPKVPLRELIQNGIDAVRLRQIVDPQAPPPMVSVDFQEVDGRQAVRITDNGIGLSSDDFVDKLLSFGSSGWMRDASIGEYNEKFPSKDAVSGRYGLGFFSVFMISDHVKITSRRFDAASDKTVVLHFEDGLNQRPVIFHAENEERKTSGGTTVELVLSDSRSTDKLAGFSRAIEEDGDSGNEKASLAFSIGRLFPASDVPITVTDENQSVLVDGREWMTEPAGQLLERLEGRDFAAGKRADCVESIRLVKEADGRVVGRAGLSPWGGYSLSSLHSSHSRHPGSVVSQGAFVSKGIFRGILLGVPARAARDYANPAASPEALAAWATEQAELLCDIINDDEEQRSIAEQVVAFGGNPGNLKVCELGGAQLSLPELEALLAERDEIWIVHDAAVSLTGRSLRDATRSDSSISVAYGFPSIVSTPSHFGGWFSVQRRQMADVVSAVVARAFDIAPSIVEEAERVHDGRSVYRAPAPVWRTAGGETMYEDGVHLKRGMTEADLAPYRVK